MKKSIILSLFVVFLVSSSVNAADLKFTPDGGGYFIYCNNNEFIRRMDLSDSSNPEPTYIMNNLNMTNGKYTLYFSHINHTELTKSQKPIDSSDIKKMNLTQEQIDEFSEVIEAGFDIETDVLFRAETNTKIRITSIGFEVQQPLDYYYTNRLIRYEDSWGCLNAVADYMQRPIYGLNSVSKYINRSFTPVEVEIKAGETMWLSEFIDNYCTVPWLKPVHLLADFEILYGCTDINIAAIKSTGVLRDRSTHRMDAKHGPYYRDKQYKGIANTLPSVTANLEYTIDDNTADGASLPVTVFNQYIPEGNEVTTWVTHLNPQNDKNARRIIAESDMLSFKYFDPAKRKLYGEDIPASERDTVWVFDTYHSDTKKFDNTLGIATKETFRPNYEINILKNNTSSSGNFANYCVKTNYHLKVKNDGKNTRFFNYVANTTASIVVSVKDKNGAYVSNHSIHKVYSDKSTAETMACVELAPESETKFIIEVFLPINYVGGIKNSFVISNEKTEQTFPEDQKQGCTVDKYFTGKNFVKWENNSLLVSQDGKAWSEVNVENNVREIFEGNSDNYKITYLNGYYVVMWHAFVPTPAYYTPYLKYKSDIYFLDDDFRLAKTYSAENYPEEITFAGDKFYLKTDKIYESPDGEIWSESNVQDMNLPIDNNSGVILASKSGGETYMSPDNGENFYKIAYRDDVKPPRYIDVMGDVYFYAEGEFLYVSRDGVEWTRLESAGEKITSLARVENKFIVNGIKEIEIPTLPSYINVVIDGTVMQYDRQVKHYDTGTLVPLEISMEHLGIDYKYNQKTGEATINHNDTEIKLKTGSNLLRINNKKVYATCSVQYSYDRVFIPANEVFSALGFDVEYIEKSNTIVISKQL